MRLLNVHTLEFEEFNDDSRPPYLTISHRWSEPEITYQDFCARDSRPEVTETAGFKKVSLFCKFVRTWGQDLSSCPPHDSAVPNSKGYCGSCFSKRFQCDGKKPRCTNCLHDGVACEYNSMQPRAADTDNGGELINSAPASKSCKACSIAHRTCTRETPACAQCQQHGMVCQYDTSLTAITAEADYSGTPNEIQWIWIDTVCIDKKSSTELSEAINSMFTWYRQSQVCLVYLQDVRPNNYAPYTVLHDFRNSSWFTRGWTLQELLAPNLVVFLNQNWQVIGHKAGRARILARMSASKIQMPLNPFISRITGIPETALLDCSSIAKLSIDERVKWMKNRTTTRVEDRAYCLLGICEVSLPLVYGEGIMAYKRLENAINDGTSGDVKKVQGLSDRLTKVPDSRGAKTTLYERVDELLDPSLSERGSKNKNDNKKTDFGGGQDWNTSDPMPPSGYGPPPSLPYGAGYSSGMYDEGDPIYAPNIGDTSMPLPSGIPQSAFPMDPSPYAGLPPLPPPLPFQAERHLYGYGRNSLAHDAGFPPLQPYQSMRPKDFRPYGRRSADLRPFDLDSELYDDFYSSVRSNRDYSNRKSTRRSRLQPGFSNSAQKPAANHDMLFAEGSESELLEDVLVSQNQLHKRLDRLSEELGVNDGPRNFNTRSALHRDINEHESTAIEKRLDAMFERLKMSIKAELRPQPALRFGV